MVCVKILNCSEEICYTHFTVHKVLDTDIVLKCYSVIFTLKWFVTNSHMLVLRKLSNKEC